MGLARPHVDTLPLGAQPVLFGHERAVRRLDRISLGVQNIAAEVGVGLQHAARLPAVGIVAQLILLRGPRRGDHLAGARHRAEAEQTVACGVLVVAHVLVRQPHDLAGERMRYVVPNAARHVVPGLHQIPRHWDQLHRLARALVAHDPVVAVAALQAARLQHLLANKRGHSLVRPDVQQPQQLVVRALARPRVDHIIRQLRDAVAQQLNAAVDRAELARRALRVFADGQTAGGRQAADRYGLAHGGRACGRRAQALDDAHA